MKPWVGLAVIAIALGATSTPSPAQLAYFPDGEALTQPLRSFDTKQQALFRQGVGLFRQSWLITPSADHPDFQGLGPLYNRLSCIACHIKNGRGSVPPGGESLRNMVVRFSLGEADANGAPTPHPVYGGQLNPEGIPGVSGEGTATFSYATFEVVLNDGERVEMRRPRLELRNLAYGPLTSETRISVRNAPPVAGLGLLENVPDQALRSIANENGGRVNEVWNIETRQVAIGRFGLKANQPSLIQQNANAFVEDLGITSHLFPRETCASSQKECLTLMASQQPAELTETQLAAVTFYVANLAPPQRRSATNNQAAAEGKEIFHAIGCASCHRETLPLASGGTIHPYTDLLLHDLGEELADGRSDFKAGPRDWRTAPLWGLGLVGQTGETANYLHDGRARTVTEAILWHGGEAEIAAAKFKALSRLQRGYLLAFLDSL